jgi:hypothetical protein
VRAEPSSIALRDAPTDAPVAADAGKGERRKGKGGSRTTISPCSAALPGSASAWKVQVPGVRNGSVSSLRKASRSTPFSGGQAECAGCGSDRKLYATPSKFENETNWPSRTSTFCGLTTPCATPMVAPLQGT